MTVKPIIRKIQRRELVPLLELYTHLHTSDPRVELHPRIDALWNQIMEDPFLHYLVVEVEGEIVSTCSLAVIPNLTRGANPYGVIENLVTHPSHRKRGYATKLLQATLKLAWEEGCYKVNLLSTRKDDKIVRFYENAGFQTGMKKAFLAVP